jgi:hypothetical protein
MRKQLILMVLCLWAVFLSSPVWADDERLIDEKAFVGKPSLHEGDALGYFVWKTGDTWHLRWTTFGAMRRFTGRVTALGGEIDSLKRIDVESERHVIRPGRTPRVVRGPRGRARVVGGRPPVVAEREQDKIEREDDHTIVFRSFTNDDLDGFDFKLDNKAHRVRLVLEVDGAMKTELIKIGPYKSSVDADPFVIRIR